MLAGSWLECQHIVVNLLLGAERTAGNEALYRRVWEQRLYLDNITQLMQEFHGDPELDRIREGYERLLDLYRRPEKAEDVTKEHLQELAQSLASVRAIVTG